VGVSNILAKILDTKRREVALARSRVSYETMMVRAKAAPAPRDFVQALRRKLAAGAPGVIAEIKRASPSAGAFRGESGDFDAARFAASYEKNGAACLSVLTDRAYFGGSPDDLIAARAACDLPVLRKDFIVDPYQIVESRAMGADAVLFIMDAVPIEWFRDWEQLATELGLAVLAESHNCSQVADALTLQTPLIGINNRDLTRFATDVATTLTLKPSVPDERILVSESGIDTPDIARRLRSAGVNAFLIGGAFMSKSDPGAALAAHFSA
jgi:indole-3-glycerol phosphate synthase